MPQHLRNSRTTTRETHQAYRGKPLIIEIGPDGVFLWPKGTRQKVKLNLEAAYERALAGRAAPLPEGRQMGLSARRRGRTVAELAAVIAAERAETAATLSFAHSPYRGDF